MNKSDAALLDHVQTPIFVLEPDSQQCPRYVAFNKIACQSGNVTIDQILGLTALELYPGQSGKVAYERHCTALSTGMPATYELTLPLGGRDLHVRTHLQPVKDDQGNVIRLIGTSTDINAEYAVRQAAASSILNSSDIEDFVAFAAHDLRSPIRNVAGIAELLKDNFQDMGDGKLELINMLESIASKATRLISDVLAHAEQTHATESIECFELAQLCADIMGMLDPARRHEIEVKTCVIFGDKIATQLILRNLIDNAIKHNPNSNLLLTVAARKNDSEHFEVVVTDNGVGFPDPAVAFLSNGAFRSESGFGLLGICRLIESRKGTIAARQSDSGQGAHIRFALPGKIIRSAEGCALNSECFIEDGSACDR